MIRPGVLSLTTSLGQLIRTWWRQDRIRVGRSCGQLLSLNIGDRLLMDDNVFMVVKRWTDAQSASVTDDREANASRVADEWFDESSTGTVPTRIEYWLTACTDQRGEVARLIVPLAQPDSITFACGQQIRELLPEEIVILYK